MITAEKQVTRARNKEMARAYRGLTKACTPAIPWEQNAVFDDYELQGIFAQAAAVEADGWHEAAYLYQRVKEHMLKKLRDENRLPTQAETALGQALIIFYDDCKPDGVGLAEDQVWG